MEWRFHITTLGHIFFLHWWSTLIQFQWYYNECYHGKGPIDGVGGTLKSMIFQHVKSKKYVINGAEILLSM